MVLRKNLIRHERCIKKFRILTQINWESIVNWKLIIVIG